MTNLDPKVAFFHVIDDHRWLSASGCAWNLVGGKVTSAAKTAADLLLPNIDVMVRDCLLLHARSLIDFYRSTGNRQDDILLSNFSLSVISTQLLSNLEKYKQPIEKHLLHLTDSRDLDYRNPNSANAAIYRPNWDSEAHLIVELILDCLKDVSTQATQWQQPFTDLYVASATRYRDKTYAWPKNLGEKADVEKYLAPFKI
jgi:hypothetical protein